MQDRNDTASHSTITMTASTITLRRPSRRRRHRLLRLPSLLNMFLGGVLSLYLYSALWWPVDSRLMAPPKQHSPLSLLREQEATRRRRQEEQQPPEPKVVKDDDEDDATMPQESTGNDAKVGTVDVDKDDEDDDDKEQDGMFTKDDDDDDEATRPDEPTKPLLGKSAKDRLAEIRANLEADRLAQDQRAARRQQAEAVEESAKHDDKPGKTPRVKTETGNESVQERLERIRAQRKQHDKEHAQKDEVHRESIGGEDAQPTEPLLGKSAKDSVAEILRPDLEVDRFEQDLLVAEAEAVEDLQVPAKHDKPGKTPRVTTETGNESVHERLERIRAHRQQDRKHHDKEHAQKDKVHRESIGGEDNYEPSEQDLEALAKEERRRARKKKKERKLPVVDPRAREAAIEGDPLRADVWEFESKGKLPIHPQVEYLGTLIDAGRHYFPLEWLKRAVDRLSDMNYNLIQLRLTDDQTFNVMLERRPLLAYPTAVDNPKRAVYSVAELRELTAYAKERGIAIMPEVNVPGHAGSWAGIPDMIVQCPNFICTKGYGLPLNVKHPDLHAILKDIIEELVDIFDDPPFLHLGGDEVNMADPCFREVGITPFDYPAFEQELKTIIASTGYPEERIVRWEMTGQKDLDRAGGIEQFWESHPGVRHDAKGPFFVSTWMYFDTNGNQDAYEVYTKAVKNFHLKKRVLPKAIIAGTFELSTQFWYDRNILGRLLAVAIGAANPQVPKDDDDAKASDDIIEMWEQYCEHLGFGEIICETKGRPVIDSTIYQQKWRDGWKVWKHDICERLTVQTDVHSFRSVGRAKGEGFRRGSQFFWENFPLQVPPKQAPKRPATSLPTDLEGLLRHKVPHTGVILDAVSAMPGVDRLMTIITDYLGIMGFNLVQLRLINNYGFVFESEQQPGFGHSLIAGDDNPIFSLKPDLSELVETAKTVGIDVMPEISVSTDAAGWYKSGFLVDCPTHFCAGRGTPVDVNSVDFLPIVFSVIGELRKVFSSRFIHLGSDERASAKDCFEEAQLTPDFDAFEHKMETLLALADYAPAEVLRYENLEGIRYEERAGGVTQYAANHPSSELRNNELFFLTVNLFKGDGYTIFEKAKEAVALKPLGVMAELRKLNEAKWKSWSIHKRLLAFAMGVSDIAGFWSIYDAASFNSYFVRICEALELDVDCSPPGGFSKPVTVITETAEFTKKACEVRTEVSKQRVAKKVEPFYEKGVSVGIIDEGIATG